MGVQVEVSLNGEGVDLRSSFSDREEWFPTYIPADKTICLSVMAKENYFEVRRVNVY